MISALYCVIVIYSLLLFHYPLHMKLKYYLFKCLTIHLSKTQMGWSLVKVIDKITQLFYRILVLVQLKTSTQSLVTIDQFQNIQFRSYQFTNDFLLGMRALRFNAAVYLCCASIEQAVILNHLGAKTYD